MIQTPSLPFDTPAPEPRVIAPTSREAWDAVKQTVPLRDLLIVAAVDDYRIAHLRFEYADVTGMELADWLRRPITSVRPSLTRAEQAGYLSHGARRKSRHAMERPCAPYQCAVPRQAIDRAIQQAKMTSGGRNGTPR